MTRGDDTMRRPCAIRGELGIGGAQRLFWCLFLAFVSLHGSGCGTKSELDVNTGCDADPAQLDFGTTPIGTPVRRGVTIWNLGDTPLTLQPSSDHAAFTLVDASAYPLAIEPRGFAEVIVEFDPAEAGDASGLIALGEMPCGPIACLATGSPPIRSVLADGSGPYATIQAAINAADAGDIVQLGDGTFTGPGNWDITLQGKSLTIRSGSGQRANCRIVGRSGLAGGNHILSISNGQSQSTTIKDLTIANGHGSTGGGVAIVDASPRFERVLFDGNIVTGGGGAVHVSGNSAPEFDDCEFFGNRSGVMDALMGASAAAVDPMSGGAIFVDPLTGADCVVRHSLFRENTNVYSGSGGAIYGRARISNCTFEANASFPSSGKGGACFLASGSVSRSLFADNTAGQQGSALYLASSSEGVNIVNCTIVANGVTQGSFGAAVYSEWNTSIQNCIVAFNGPLGIAFGAVSPALLCCDYYGNGDADGGAVMHRIGRDGNFAADPLFSDRGGGNYHLTAQSPCLPGGHEDCGLIGALGMLESASRRAR
ncbi:MAG: hypothetical protein IPK64_00165 [bacterium]|nr:hypothetical protein [bacterium]